MSTPPLRKLNAFSQRFTTLLFERFPDFEQDVLAPREFQHAEDLYIEVPCPFPSELHWPLAIWTKREREIGVGMDAFHTHFISGRNSSESQTFSEGLSFLTDIFAERIVILSFVTKGELGSSSFHSPDEISAEIAKSPPGILVRVRSWRGTYLQDYEG